MNHTQRAREILASFYVSLVANEGGDALRSVDALAPALEAFEADDAFTRENVGVLENLLAALEAFEAQPGRHVPTARAMTERALALRLRIIDVPL